MYEYLNMTKVDYFTRAGGHHVYWSTHCRHGNQDGPPWDNGHDACLATELAPGVARKPAQCKTCASLCICACHLQVIVAIEDDPAIL